MILVDAHHAATALDLVVLGGSLAELAAHLDDAGTGIRTLTIRPTRGEHLDLTDIDFAHVTPRLHTLKISGARINATAFTHPTLTRLALTDVEYVGPREIPFSDTLERVRIEKSLLPAASFTVGARSSLRTFRWDEQPQRTSAAVPLRRLEGPRLLRLVTTG